MNNVPTSTSFIPHEYECPECKDRIHSSYSGEFVTCKCGSSSVDETYYYTRLIGNILPKYIGEYQA